MSSEVNGELVPLGGGDAIPLLRDTLTIGRRESCDICMQVPNVSGIHCELRYQTGYWTIRDLNSTNGIKVNGVRVTSRPLKPGDEVSIGKRRFNIIYKLNQDAQSLLESLLTEDEDLFGMSLLEKAGLQNMSPPPRRNLPPKSTNPPPRSW